MVLVDPHARGRGVGTRLLERGLSLVAEDVTARLDATPAGEVLYRQLGFVGEYRLARWYLDGGFTPQSALRVPAGGVRPLQPDDWPSIREMDLIAFGASRLTLLERLARDAPEYAWVLERKRGSLQGFLLGRHGHVREHLGPLITDDHDSARVLLESCLAANGGRSLFIDVPDARVEWTDALSRAGFAIERPFLRMYRGQLTAAGNPSQIFAICGPEFG
jgi:Acetyltransferase (GNAT) domain